METVIVPLDVVMKVDYLRAIVQFHDNPENVFKLEGGDEWGRSIALLKEVIKFTEDEEAYVPPNDEKLYF